MPSTSPSRILRVVAETENHTHGARGLIHSMTLSLPTPDGPESTVRRAGVRASSVTKCLLARGLVVLSPFLPNRTELVATGVLCRWAHLLLGSPCGRCQAPGLRADTADVQRSSCLRPADLGRLRSAAGRRGPRLPPIAKCIGLPGIARRCTH